MMCNNCGNKTATTHIKRTINGQTEELHLCTECALKLGFNNFPNFDLSDLWGSLFGDTGVHQIREEARCEGCGTTFSDIAKTGMAGCPKCYSTFYDKLLPSLQRIHGKLQHIGKVPSTAGKKAKIASRLINLKEELSKAIEEQEFEKAAKLRDEISGLTKEDSDNE